MKPLARLLVVLGALSPLLLFILPMWSIELEAPQYPPPYGLGMKIYINKIEGKKENDLGSINNLNHYIGMKRIEPDSIKELTIMPPLVIALSVLGLAAALIGKRKIVIGWLVIVAIAGCIGLYDFYTWEVDYGTNLDPHAIIKIEDMTYVPPLIGTKELLNFTARSWPDTGFMVLGLGMALTVAACFMKPRVEPS